MCLYSNILYEIYQLIAFQLPFYVSFLPTFFSLLFDEGGISLYARFNAMESVKLINVERRNSEPTRELTWNKKWIYSCDGTYEEQWGSVRYFIVFSVCVCVLKLLHEFGIKVEKCSIPKDYFFLLFGCVH